ncbi:MAG: hypothetical protein NC483_07330, partial [Ruminococcus sp.]|nr:hypothetical protein [Ruminococcus sp.]
MENLNSIRVKDIVNLDQDFVIDLNKCHHEDIIGLDNLHVKGFIKFNVVDNLEINLVVTGTMFIKDSITLDTIESPINGEIIEEYSLEDPFLQEYYEKEQNVLDIMEILWENIVLEVPISLTNAKDVNLSGD